MHSALHIITHLGWWTNSFEYLYLHLKRVYNSAWEDIYCFVLLELPSAEKAVANFYLCVLSNLFSKCQSHRKQSHICCSFTFLHCAFSSVSLNCLPEKSHSHIGCICLTLLHCALTNVSSSPQLAWKDAKSHWLHFFDFSPLCVFKCVLKALE